MAMQQVEFEFPDPDKEEKGNLEEVEIEAAEEKSTDLEVEGAVGREDIQNPQKKQEVKETIEAGEVEIEVEDDTPQADRGRKPSDPPEEVTDEELENYSKKVKKRIQQFSKGYHDERRAKETALREREALEAYAKKLVEENQELKRNNDRSYNAMVATVKQKAESDLLAAQKMYKEAYESGDSEAVLEAQQILHDAQSRATRAKSMRTRSETAANPTETSLQTNTNPVQQQEEAPKAQEVQRDERAEAWRDDNPWFGSDDEMTAFALGLHNKLVKEGVDPRSDDYYEKINSRMRTVFPDQFDDGIEDEPETAPKKRPSNVGAPATRSTAPKKVRLTQSQVAIAKRLGVPLEQYAKQAAQLSRNS